MRNNEPAPDVIVYRRSLVVALFVVVVFAAVWLLGQTFFVGLQNWGRYSELVSARGFPLYWANVGILAVAAFGIVWNVRAEYRDGHPFGAGIALAGLSFVPLLLGVSRLLQP